MLTRQVKACKNCPYNPPIDLQVKHVNGIKLNIFDVDLVIEVGKRIEAIAEIKHYKDAASYNKFYMPAHEFIGLKKVAKSLRCTFLFIIYDGRNYYIGEIDRFKKKETENLFGKRVVSFDRDKFRVLSSEELDLFLLNLR